MVNKKDSIDDFTQHINSIHPAIQFTVERKEEGKIAMLDTIAYLLNRLTVMALHTCLSSMAVLFRVFPVLCLAEVYSVVSFP